MTDDALVAHLPEAHALTRRVGRRAPPSARGHGRLAAVATFGDMVFGGRDPHLDTGLGGWDGSG